jgi:PKD repeat protein
LKLWQITDNLKKQKQNIKLRELFRQKLEYAEVVPDAEVRTKLMHRVAREEFLNFNAGSLNIYYLGAILATGITAAVLLFSSSENSASSNPSGRPGKMNSSDTGSYIEIPVGEPLTVKPADSHIIHNESIKRTRISQPPDKSMSGTSKVKEAQRNNSSIPTRVSNPISNNGLLTYYKVDKKKLQRDLNTDGSLIAEDASSGCAPFKVKFHSNSSPGDSCRWTFGDGGSSMQKDPEWIYEVEGEYKVLLEVIGPNEKHLTSTASIIVYPRPQAHFEILAEKAVFPDDEIRFLNYSTNAVRFIWDFGDGSSSESNEPRHTYIKFSNYNVQLVAYSEFGCSDSMTVFNAFSGSEYFIDFPNAFIPNAQGPSGGYYSSKSDEAAQVFHPSYSDVSEYQLKIFSKLGIPIFESNDINLGWDGYNKGQLCEPGVYIWKVRGKFRNGTPFIKMGDVTLLKN